MFTIKRTGSVDFLTSDVPRMVDFYHGLLGLPLYEPWDGNEDAAVIDVGNLVICLMRTTDPTPPPTHTAVDSGVRDPQGFDSIAFHVDDLDAAMAALDGKVNWLSDEADVFPQTDGSTLRSRALRDPDGNLVCLQVSSVSAG